MRASPGMKLSIVPLCNVQIDTVIKDLAVATESACLADVEFVGPASARYSQQSLERHGVCGHAAHLLHEVCLELHIVLKQAQVTGGGEQALGGEAWRAQPLAQDGAGHAACRGGGCTAAGTKRNTPTPHWAARLPGTHPPHAPASPMQR